MKVFNIKPDEKTKSQGKISGKTAGKLVNSLVLMTGWNKWFGSGKKSEKPMPAPTGKISNLFSSGVKPKKSVSTIKPQNTEMKASSRSSAAFYNTLMKPF